jgi:heat shock protein HslJ
MRHRPRRIAFLIVAMSTLAGVCLASCALRGNAPPVSGVGSPVRSTATTTTPPAARSGLRPHVANVEWRLEWIQEDDRDVPQEGNSVTLWLRTEGASVSGSSGCNTYRGTYAAEGVALRVQLIGSTLAACAAPIRVFEQLYLRELANVEYYAYSDDMLWLTDGRTDLFFHHDPSPTPSATSTPAVSATASAPASLLPRIADRTWTLTRYIQDGWVYPLMENERWTLWLRT